MDFFQQQARARKKTGELLFMFALGVICLITLTYLLVVVALHFWGGRAGPHPIAISYWYWNPLILAGVAAILLMVISGRSLYKVSDLSGGGQSVALLVGGRQIAPSTTDFAEKRLLNVVEEMAIASGVSVPP